MCEKCNHDLKDRISTKVWLFKNQLNKSFSEWTNPYVDAKKFEKKSQEWYKIINKFFVKKSEQFTLRYDELASWVWFLWKILNRTWIIKAAPVRELTQEEILKITQDIFKKEEFYDVVHSFYWEELPEWFLKELRGWMVENWVEQAWAVSFVNDNAKKVLNDYFYKWSTWYMVKVQSKLEDIVLYWFQDWKSTYNIRNEIIKKIKWIAVENADMIARTESIRVSTEVSIWMYKDIWVVKYELLPATTCCPVCRNKASMNPFSINDRSWMSPVHVNCRCSVLPILDNLK